MRSRDVEPVQRRGDVRQQIGHHGAGQRQVSVEPAPLLHLGLQTRTLDRGGHRGRIHLQQRDCACVVAAGTIRPHVERTEGALFRPDQRHQQAGSRAGAAFGRRVIGHRESFARRQHLSDRPLSLERRAEIGGRVLAPAGQAVADTPDGAIGDIHAGRIVIDERRETIQDAAEHRRRIVEFRGETKRVNHRARAVNDVGGDLD